LFSEKKDFQTNIGSVKVVLANCFFFQISNYQKQETTANNTISKTKDKKIE
jgi:hypothetical protein